VTAGRQALTDGDVVRQVESGKVKAHVSSELNNLGPPF
jgi:hypothetical protein